MNNLKRPRQCEPFHAIRARSAFTQPGPPTHTVSPAWSTSNGTARGRSVGVTRSWLPEILNSTGPAVECVPGRSTLCTSSSCVPSKPMRALSRSNASPMSSAGSPSSAIGAGGTAGTGTGADGVGAGAAAEGSDCGGGAGDWAFGSGPQDVTSRPARIEASRARALTLCLRGRRPA
jgi:hypothetical protein